MVRKARSPALRHFHRAVASTARPLRIRILYFAARPPPAPLTISISKSHAPAERDSAPPFAAATVA